MPTIHPQEDLLALPGTTATLPRERHNGGRARPAVQPALSIDDLSVRYGSTVAVDAVSFEVAPGEILCVLGASGSGKSTLLRVIAGVERASSGRIRIAGVDVAGPAAFVEAERRRVGMVFQDYALFPHLSVEKNVAFGLKGRPAADVREIVADLLARVGLAHRAGSYPHALSGGERQRIALARALAPRPHVLLMDEPFSSLDGPLRGAIRQDTVDLLRTTRTTTLLVTHDPEEALRVADRIALLDRGRLVQCASPEDLYCRPAAACAARVFGPVNELPGTCRDGHVETPLGRFAASQLPPESRARVFIRPHHLQVTRQPGGLAARTLRSTFLGDARHAILEAPGLEAPLVARTQTFERLEPDTIVYVDVTPGEAMVVPER